MWTEFKTAVQQTDVAPLDRACLGGLAEQIGSTRAVLDGLEARIAVALRKLGSSEATTAETLRQRTGCSTREAKLRTRRAETLQSMPNVAEALSSGQLTGEHASALAKAAAETSPEAVDADAGLLAQTASMPADLAGKRARDWARERQTGGDLNELHQWQRRNRSLTFTDGEGGMLNGFARFDQVSGAQFRTLVEALADRLYRANGGRDNPHARSRAQCRHDALLSLVGVEPLPTSCDQDETTIDDTLTRTDTNPTGSSQDLAIAGVANVHASGLLRLPGRSKPATLAGCSYGRGLGVRGQFSIVMDLPHIASKGTTGRCEAPGLSEIARSELERLACDADIYGLIFDGDGLPLNHGRKVRTVSPQQWRMLVARDRGCVICGARPEWCQAHHIEAWLRGGRTDLANLALVCHAHHRWIHDNNIVLQRSRDGWKAPPGLPPPGRSHHPEALPT